MSVRVSFSVVDLRKGRRGDPPSGGQNFFIFMSSLVKIIKIIGWPPLGWYPLRIGALGEILDPPLLLNRRFQNDKLH